jgi:hypothetical protein
LKVERYRKSRLIQYIELAKVLQVDAFLQRHVFNAKVRKIFSLSPQKSPVQFELTEKKQPPLLRPERVSLHL